LTRRSDRCSVQYVVGLGVDEARAFGLALADQLAVAEMGIGVTVGADGLVCPVVAGVARDTDCIGVDPATDPVGAVSVGFVISADGYGSALFAPVGVVLVVLPAGADVVNRSRLAQEEIFGDNRWKAFIDIVPDDRSWCVGIDDGANAYELGTRLGGDRSECPDATA
jgi:hypothetical protein